MADRRTNRVVWTVVGVVVVIALAWALIAGLNNGTEQAFEEDGGIIDTRDTGDQNQNNVTRTGGGGQNTQDTGDGLYD